MPSVYLAGPIHGCTDDECKGWRADARKFLGPKFTVIDPMDFDCRGKELGMWAEIIKHDLNRLEKADYVLVNAERPSWGTAMEMVYAGQAGKPSFAFVGVGVRPSPWLRGHSSMICETLAEACIWMNRALASTANQCFYGTA